MEEQEASHVFTQVVMQNLSITAAEAEDLVEELNEVTGQKMDLETMLTKANLTLQPMNIKIVKSRHPRQEHWILSVISLETPDSQDVRREISQDKFLQLVDAFFTKSRKYERTLKHLTSSKISEQDVWAFVDEGWIEQEDNGSFIPCAKLLYQGEKYLADSYEDGHLFKCLGCHAYVLFGRFCKNKDCRGCTHRRCDHPYRQKEQLDPNVCPLCNDTFAAANNEQ